MSSRNGITLEDFLDCVRVVNGWVGLPGAAKVCWYGIVEQAMALGTIRTTSGAIAAYQRTTTRSVDRYLKSLASAGLIQVVDRRAGEVVIYVEDPRVIARVRVDRSLGPQLELDLDGQDRAGVEGEEAEDYVRDTDALVRVDRSLDQQPRLDSDGRDRAGVGGVGKPQRFAPPGLVSLEPRRFRRGTAAEPPQKADPPLHTHQHKKDSNSTSTSESLEILNGYGYVRETERKNCGGSAEHPPGTIKTLGEALLERFAGGDQAFNPQRYARELQSRVGDPKLHLKVCLRAAEAVLGGRISTRHLDRIIEDLREASSERKILNSRGAFFCDRLKRLFQERGINFYQQGAIA